MMPKKDPAGPGKKIVLPPDHDADEISTPESNDPDILPDPDEALLDTPPYEAPEPGEGP